MYGLPSRWVCTRIMQVINQVLDFSFMYTIILLGTFLVWSMVSILEQSLYRATGYTLPGFMSMLYTWGIANPTWAWSILPTKNTSNPTYIL